MRLSASPLSSGSCSTAWRSANSAAAKRRLLALGDLALELGLAELLHRHARIVAARRVRRGAGRAGAILVVVIGAAEVAQHRLAERQRRRHGRRRLRAGRADGDAAEHAAGAARRLRGHGRLEIIGDAALLNVGGDVEQPQQQEERHHRRDEIGIGDLPGAAMRRMAAMAFDLLDDERLVRLAPWRVSVRSRRGRAGFRRLPRPRRRSGARRC